MSLKPVGKTNSNLSGYGIHGTHEPESTGRMSSNGCIRMKNKEVNELYSIVPRGTDVIIKAK
jgi:lipoprotein-anchoring transpeptidase ErfK/SrfK